MAEKKPLIQEVATAEKDIDIFSGYLGKMENPDKVLQYESQGRGVRIYEELDKDGQVYAMLQTRALSVQSCEWDIIPPSGDPEGQKKADFIKCNFENANFDGLTRDLIHHGVLCGYKPVENMWDTSEGDVWIKEFRSRRPSRFTFDMQGNPKLLTLQSPYLGEPIPNKKFLIWNFGGHEWNPYGRGLGYQLYWPVWFKKNDIKFWLTYSEKFGSPTPVGKYPPGASDEDRATLLAAIDSIEQETGITIPNSMVIEFLEATRSGQSNTYQQLIDCLDNGIAKTILGQTLTSDAGKSGSYALGQVHNEVRYEIRKGDADSICEYLNRTLIPWIIDYNFPVKGRNSYPKVWRRVEPPRDMKALAERDKIILVDMGLGKYVPQTYLSNTYNIPLAKDGEQVIEIPEPKPAINQPDKTLSKPTQFAEREDAAVRCQADIELLGDELLAVDEMDKFLQPVFSFIEDATSMEEIGEKLFETYPTMNSKEFQELLTRALFVSALTGYGASQNA